MSDSCVLPRFDSAQAELIGRNLYGLEGPLKLLQGERDLNFRISDARGEFVLKIANAEESAQMLDCQHRVFDRLAANRVFPAVAQVLRSVNGNEIETVQDSAGQSHFCRVLPFLDGQVWSALGHSSPALLANLGECLGALDLALAGFAHPGLDRPLLWDMEKTGTRLADYKPMLESEQDLRLVEHFEAAYLRQVEPLRTRLRRGVIHNDANRGNVLVDEDGEHVTSIIDFGDMIDSWLVLEPAIAATYAMHDQTDPLACAVAVVRGYHRSLPLHDIEIDVLFDLIGMRLCMSLCLCAYQQRLQPDNTYLSVDQQQTRTLLQQFYPLERGEVQARLRAACAQD